MIIGIKFNKLTVIKFAYKKNGKKYWLCRCNCGNETNVSTGNLNQKQVQSCGCSRKGINKGNKNGNWSGNKIGFSGIHAWVNKYKSKPKDGLCEKCKKIPFYDLANITGIYNRDFKNWVYWCRKCHMKDDGRLEGLIKSKHNKKI